jgi:hypothetical protein
MRLLVVQLWKWPKKQDHQGQRMLLPVGQLLRSLKKQDHQDSQMLSQAK